MNYFELFWNDESFHYYDAQNRLTRRVFSNPIMSMKPNFKNQQD